MEREQKYLPKNDRGQRRFKRHEVDYLHGSMLFSSEINILDISMDGTAVTTTQLLAIGREDAEDGLELRMSVCICRTVWCGLFSVIPRC
jgi:hypothetical protein